MQRPADNVYSHQIKITENDIDELGHVNNIVYVRWVQDASAAHWFHLVSEEVQQHYLWVVLRHEIDYLTSALLQDEIIAYTWVGEHRGAKSERLVQICDAHTNKIFAQAKTTWCLLSSKDLRPVRIDKEMMRILGRS